MPLAERLRPQSIDEVVGQEHLVGEGKPLRVLLAQGHLPSLILWGPPGTGKTTLARLFTHHLRAEFHQLNAVSSGVKDVREVLERAERLRARQGLPTVLFIDEIHRFNKAQQDALLHSVEGGLITLIGATTENPSFEVIAPLLSRCRVYVLHPLAAADLQRLIDRALTQDPLLAPRGLTVEDRDLLLLYSGGDGRTLLNGLETAAQLAAETGDGTVITRACIEEAFQRRMARHDRAGEEHYNLVSAFIKSVRGSDPDAAVYWLARMLEGGEDPLFIARRLIILASEDVGNADPYGLTLAVSAFDAVDRIGLPEAQLVLSQATTYLACAPKSNASTLAIGAARDDIRSSPPRPVPLHLRNAPTALMKDMGYGDGYRYSHDFPGHVTEQQYLPDGMADTVYYRPADTGAELKIRDRLAAWWPRRKR
jgi:putative ATPase